MVELLNMNEKEKGLNLEEKKESTTKIRNIENLIADNRINQAFAEMGNSKEVTILKEGYDKVKDDWMMSLITQEEEMVEKNKILKKMLEIIHR